MSCRHYLSAEVIFGTPAMDAVPDGEADPAVGGHERKRRGGSDQYEMTQDVIEWDETRAVEVHSAFKSPHQSHCTGLVGLSSSNTRSSTSGKQSIKTSRTPPTSASSCHSRRSSIFLSAAKRNLNDVARRSNGSYGEAKNNGRSKPQVNATSTSEKKGDESRRTPNGKKAEKEIHGILFLLQNDDECDESTTESDVEQVVAIGDDCVVGSDDDDKNNGQNIDSIPSRDEHSDAELQQTQRRNNKRGLVEELKQSQSQPDTTEQPTSSSPTSEVDEKDSAAVTALASRRRRRQDGIEQKRHKSDTTLIFSTLTNGTSSHATIIDGSCNAAHENFNGLLQEILEPSSGPSPSTPSLPSVAQEHNPEQLPRAPLASVDRNMRSAVDLTSGDLLSSGCYKTALPSVDAWARTPPRAAKLIQTQDHQQRHQEQQQQQQQQQWPLGRFSALGHFDDERYAFTRKRSHSMPMHLQFNWTEDVQPRSASTPSLSRPATILDSSVTAPDVCETDVPDSVIPKMTQMLPTANTPADPCSFKQRKKEASVALRTTDDNTLDEFADPALDDAIFGLNIDCKGQSPTTVEAPHNYSVGIPSTVSSPHSTLLAVRDPKSSSFVASVKREGRPYGNEEFGDFLSNADFIDIDQAVASRMNQPPLLKPTATTCKEEEFGSFDDVDFAQMDALVATREVATSDDTIDEFGDLPDLDFDAMDQQVAHRIQNCAPLSTRCVVQNLKREQANDADLSFIGFSRYKVLHVDVDPEMCKKTLSVAAWTQAMINDYDDERALHKNCTIVASRRDGEQSNLPNLPCNLAYPKAGEVVLRGEWFHARVVPGDIVHVCSLMGKYRTDPGALPITMHTMPPPGSEIDDLLLVLHPDKLLSPSIISETATCSRRSVLQTRIGSSGLTSKAALVGTLRHTLFEACMRAGSFSESFALAAVQKAVQENAETLVGCNLSEEEVTVEVLAALPQMHEFASQFTKTQKDAVALSSRGEPVPGLGCSPDISFLGRLIHSVEESIVSVELGLKGDLDAVVEADVKVINRKNHALAAGGCLPMADQVSERSLVAVELKTGHNQTAQNAHMAQLSLYTLMLRSRYGTRSRLYGNLLAASPEEKGGGGTTVAAPGGMLLYLNAKSYTASHLAPQLNEIKTLMSQRNGVAGDLKRASSPRGVLLAYQEGVRDDQHGPMVELFPAPAANLPELLTNPHRCKTCYSNRECMLYAASEPLENETHQELLSHFTGHLSREDLDYFLKWDRLIDLEADASTRNPINSYFVESKLRETESGDCVAGLVFDDEGSSKENDASPRVRICLQVARSNHSVHAVGASNVSPGTNVFISTDGTILEAGNNGATGRTRLAGNMVGHHAHICKGTVVSVDSNKILLRSRPSDLERIRGLVRRQHQAECSKGVAQPEGGVFFRIDTNQSTVAVGTLRWNLINFLAGEVTTEVGSTSTSVHDQVNKIRLSKLRSLVIGLKAPHFLSDSNYSTLFGSASTGVQGCAVDCLVAEFEALNPSQQMAVRKVFSAHDYTLLQGLPGTGKTSVVTFLARLLVANGKRVLITAYTHSAVDNIMMKLIEKGLSEKALQTGLSPLVRVGQGQSCDEAVKVILHTELATQAGYSGQSASALKEVMRGARIVGVSALTLPRTPLLLREHFDIVIVDEAGQMNQPATLGVLAAADSFVLVGDHKQLPPLVNSEIAQSGGYGESMLKRLAEKHPNSVVQLTTQYRMNDAICRISSEAFYDEQLKCGSEEQKTNNLVLPYFPSKVPQTIQNVLCPWMSNVLNPCNAVVFVDTDCVRTTKHSAPNLEFGAIDPLEGRIGRRASGGIVNQTEAILVGHIIQGLHDCGQDLSAIGVISPFRAQLRIMEDLPCIEEWKSQGLELSTIDKYQGRDKPTIILSMVRSNEQGNAGRLLQDERRLNVAVTRAKQKLIILGSFRTLHTGSRPLRPILDRMKQRGQRFEVPDDFISRYKSL